MTAKFDFGRAGFSSIDRTLPCGSNSTTPYRSGSATWYPNTVPPRVRAPAIENDDTALQVYALRNPAVESLERRAQTAEASGDLARAEQLLERALRIDGRDPAALQFMAEVQLQQGRIEQAAGFAQRAWDAGPQVGALCERTLRMLIVVHERSSDWDRAQQARDRLPRCRVAPPERF